MGDTRESDRIDLSQAHYVIPNAACAASLPLRWLGSPCRGEGMWTEVFAAFKQHRKHCFLFVVGTVLHSSCAPCNRSVRAPLCTRQSVRRLSCVLAWTS